VKGEEEQRECAICGGRFDPAAHRTAFAEAGEWLAEEVWHDAGELCPRCLENRGRLAMMYLHEHNT
jgi:hypothetical protein